MVARGSVLLSNYGGDERLMRTGDTATLPKDTLKIDEMDRVFTLVAREGGATWIELRDVGKGDREMCRAGSKCTYRICSYVHPERIIKDKTAVAKRC